MRGACIVFVPWRERQRQQQLVLDHCAASSERPASTTSGSSASSRASSASSRASSTVVCCAIGACQRLQAALANQRQPCLRDRSVSSAVRLRRRPPAMRHANGAPRLPPAGRRRRRQHRAHRVRPRARLGSAASLNASKFGDARRASRCRFMSASCHLCRHSAMPPASRRLRFPPPRQTLHNSRLASLCQRKP